MPTLGIDIGGTTVKSALVDVDAGRVLGDIDECPTPQPATVADLAAVVASMIRGEGAVGCTYPGRLHAGRAVTAVNLDDSWLGESPSGAFEQATGRPFVVLNDADAAGIAEAVYGAGRGVDGVIVLATLGTGVGTSVIHNRTLLPNTELGELGAAEGVSRKDSEDLRLTTSQWAANISEFCDRLVALVDPDLVVIGGSASEDDELMAQITASVEVRAAALGTSAGIIGAAFTASKLAP
jgi:polyphosphate glucokinase